MQLSRSFALPEAAQHFTVSGKMWIENRLEELGEISRAGRNRTVATRSPRLSTEAALLMQPNL
jgi:hypothetical protein